MSLLLDALKKAADDKQKASLDAQSHDVSDHESVDKASDSNASIEEPVVEEVIQEQSAVEETTSKKSSDGFDEPVEELTLDALDETLEDNVQIDAVVNDSQEEQFNNDNVVEQDETADESAEIEMEVVGGVSSERGQTHDPETSSYTVSDDALSMLIYKTNREVKHGRKVLLISLLVASLAILISGGVYYYLDMQTEIAALERKHQNAMRSMKSKTSNENAPRKSEIIRNLVSDADLDEKVEFARNVSAEKNSAGVKNNSAAGTRNAASTKRADGSTLSIMKKEKIDPVSEELDKAWNAYESTDFAEAKNSYLNVLDLESNNRDALLGLGAIAVVQGDKEKARTYYRALLDLDPRDAIATAGLTSLNDNSSIEKDQNYLLSMVKKNPQAPHLNFALGNNYAKQDKWELAQQYYFSAWQYDSENADYLFNLAVSMDQLNKQEQALTFYRESLSKSNNKRVNFSRDAVSKRINELSGS